MAISKFKLGREVYNVIQATAFVALMIASTFYLQNSTTEEFDNAEPLVSMESSLMLGYGNYAESEGAFPNCGSTVCGEGFTCVDALCVPDNDEDGDPDSTDPDDDNDGVEDGLDAAPFDPFACSDVDADTCDDCSSGTFDINSDGTDTDGDSICDAGDPDDDNDGVPDGQDAAPLNNLICSDTDADGCDDCSSGTYDPANDGQDTDGDGICDAGDIEECDGVDNNGDGNVDEGLSDIDGDGVCDELDGCEGDDNTGDIDGDGICDDIDPCFGNDPTDSDGDGICDDLDACQGDDGVGDVDGDGICDDLDPCPIDANNDEDGDGFCTSDGDCDDNDPNRNPDATDVCDGLDNDCDGDVDEDCAPDEDGDGFSADEDCNDLDADINPDATEVCDGVDNDCDGIIPELLQPDGLSATAIANTTATLQWNDVTMGGSYEAEYKIINPPGQPWNTATVGTNSRAITGLTPGELYKFRVRNACVGEGTVTPPYSLDAYFTTTISGCDVPDGLGVSGVGNTAATLNWNDVNMGAMDEYEVMYRPISPLGPWETVSSLTTNSTTVSTLTAATLYKFKVRGTCDLSGQSVNTDYSSDFYFSTTNTGCAVPDGLGASGVGNTTATLSWNDVNTQPTDEYEVMYRPISPVSGPWQTVSSLTDPTTNLTGLTPGTLYKYKVNGTCDLSGTSVTTAYSSDFYFTTDIGGCDVPDGLNATGITATGATLQWNDVNMGAMDEYEVRYRPISPLGPWQTLSSLTTNSTTLNSLTNSTLYKFRVRGTCDLSGNSVTTSYSGDFYFSTPMMLTMDDSDLRSQLTEEKEDLQVNAYPNPSSGMINLLFEPTDPGNGNLVIYGLNGSRVFETGFADRLDERVDLTASGPGLYLIRVDFSDQVFESRVLIR